MVKELAISGLLLASAPQAPPPLETCVHVIYVDQKGNAVQEDWTTKPKPKTCKDVFIYISPDGKVFRVD
jgi:hypothetical protein